MKILLLFTNFLSIALLIIAANLSYLTKSQITEYPNHIHRTLFLDRRFDEDEVEFITIAAIEWTDSTNHVVDLDVVQLPSNQLIGKNDILVTSVSPDSPDILITESTNKHVILGLYNKNEGLDTISLVSDRLVDSTYKAVVLHEIGHALGLEHNEGIEGFNTLMCPYVDFGADYITPVDLVHFCKLYHCDASKLKH